MSVISENSGRRMSNRASRTPRSVSRGRLGWESATPFIVPQFSASASEGVKLTVDEDNWAENTTVITGNTSEHSYSGAADRAIVAPTGRVVVRRCSRLFWLCSATLVCLCSILSAPIMALLPFAMRQWNQDWPQVVWQSDCLELLFSITIKSLLLIVAVWVTFFRRAPADMPQLYLQRVALTLFVVFILFAFWLFYAVTIVLERQNDYKMALKFAQYLLDALMFCHYIAVIVLEIRSHRAEFIVEILRDPDGESRSYPIGVMSIQEAAVHVLRLYYTHFPSYNAFLDKSGSGVSRFRSGSSHVSAGFKLYDIEGLGNSQISESNARLIMEATAKRRFGGHNERFHEIMEWERRVQKRKYRLISATEDAFASVQSITANNQQNKQALGEPMEAVGAAQAVFSAIARPLNRYLKLTRQQPRHNADQVVAHLARCLSLRFSAATFLQRFFSTRFPLPERPEEAKWSIVCNVRTLSAVQHGTVFVLRSHQKDENAGVQLYCTMHEVPFFNLTEQKSLTSQFALKITPESAV